MGLDANTTTATAMQTSRGLTAPSTSLGRSIRPLIQNQRLSYGLTTIGYILCIICGGFYFCIMVALLAMNCPFNSKVAYIFTFTLLAFSAVILTLGTNIVYKRGKFDCCFQSLQLFYGATTGMVAFGLIYTAREGLCAPFGYSERAGLFSSGFGGNYAVWTLSLIGVMLQIAANYCFE